MADHCDHLVVVDLDGNPAHGSTEQRPTSSATGRFIYANVIGAFDRDAALATLHAHLRWIQTTAAWRLDVLPRRLLRVDLGMPEVRVESARFRSYAKTVPQAALRALARLDSATQSGLAAKQHAAEEFLEAFWIGEHAPGAPAVRIRRGPEPDEFEQAICAPHHLTSPAMVYRCRPDGTEKPSRELVADLVHVVAARLDQMRLAHAVPEGLGYEHAHVHDVSSITRTIDLLNKLGAPLVDLQRAYRRSLRLVASSPGVSSGHRTPESRDESRRRFRVVRSSTAREG